ncbi:MAG: DUF951 domain-containing protein [Dehalococcoidia bacterium]|nr:DUF951 domain-containing protein [Dehalococcoidia bacterium]
MEKTPFKAGDRITLKKKHPCGGSEWGIYRIGADVRLICLTCEHRMKMSLRDAERRTVSRVEASVVSEGDSTSDLTVGEAPPSQNQSDE